MLLGGEAAEARLMGDLTSLSASSLQDFHILADRVRSVEEFRSYRCGLLPFMARDSQSLRDILGLIRANDVSLHQ